jgi:hypothetical protein
MTNNKHLLTALVATAAAIAGLFAAAVGIAAVLVPADHALAIFAADAAAPATGVIDASASPAAERFVAGLVVWAGVFAVLFTPVFLTLVAREGRRLAQNSGGYDAHR